jgi:hypothetical protein
LVVGNHPVESLRTLQRNLVDAVWFRKSLDYPLEIIPRLYLASCQGILILNLLGASPSLLYHYNITHVIRLGWKFSTLESDDVEYHDYPIQDSPNVDILELLDSITDLIHGCVLQGQSILVFIQYC